MNPFGDTTSGTRAKRFRYRPRKRLALSEYRRHLIHMKRTNLVLDEQVLERAEAVSGLRTYSEVVSAALREYVRLKTYAEIDQFASSGAWEGDLTIRRSCVRTMRTLVDTSVWIRHFSANDSLDLGTLCPVTSRRVRPS